MKLNAMTEVPWIPTDNGLLTPKETLEQAGDILWPPQGLNGYEVSSLTRFLCEFTAVVVQQSGWAGGVITGFSSQDIDKAVERIGEAADIFDSDTPFFQRPRREDDSMESTSSTMVKKLSPIILADRAEEFWKLSAKWPTSLALPEALLALVCFHYFSPVGNKYCYGDKCKNGSPGIRVPGPKDDRYTATEYVWVGDALLDTLLLMTPCEWVEQGGLPAWADRKATRSWIVSDRGEYVAPLWRSSWSSNVAACRWDGEQLVAVRVGGVPPEWLPPYVSQDKDSLKTWWDQRNTQDPFYFYLPNKQEELKPQRLDIGRDLTDLAVEWNAKQKSKELKKRCSETRLGELSFDHRIMFLRHEIGGKPHSPKMICSEVVLADTGRWLPADEYEFSIRMASTCIIALHNAVTAPFRRKSLVDKKVEESGRGAIVLDSLASRRSLASDSFWRQIAPVFDEVVTQESAIIAPDTWKRAGKAALAAFDETVAPAATQLGPSLYYVRGWVEKNIFDQISPYLPKKEA